MSLRNTFLLTLAAASAGWAISPMPASAQAPSMPPTPVAAPADGMTLSDGVISSLDGIELNPGETIIDGPPELKQFAAQQAAPTHAHAHAGHGLTAACSPGCYVPCEPGYYLVSEAMWMQLSGGDGFTRGLGYFFDDHDFELAPRITVGRRFDCVDGYEFVFAGMLEWDDTIVGTNNAALFQSPDANIQAAFDLFATGTSQLQRREVSYDSFEFNRTYTGWDVVRAMIGLRTIFYDEDYAFASSGSPGNPSSVVLSQSTDNLLIGPQIGLQLFYPLGRRIYSDTTLKGGLYLNFVDSDGSLLTSAPTTAVARGSSDDTEIAGMFEIGTKLGINVTRSISATIGYDVWYLTGVAESSSQLPLNYNLATPFTVNAEDDVFIHGLTAGIQVVY